MDRSDVDRVADADRLAAAARPFVENTLVFSVIDSTQDCALRLIDQAEAEEIVLPTTLIIARRQERGRGRGERSWQSPAGGLYMSWVRSEIDAESLARLPMIAAAAAHLAIAATGFDDLGIKWPNDLVVEGGKLAGLLIHARHGENRWTAVGLGVNLHHAPEITDEGARPAVCLDDLLEPGGAPDREERIVAAFAEALASGIESPEPLLDRWREHLIHHPGDEMRVRLGDGSVVEGRFAGLTDDGHLRLEVAGEERVISAGDVIE